MKSESIKGRRERRRQTPRELVQDFARSTTLHGLRYITERGLSRTEKIFWFVSFVTSVILCAILIWNVWMKWQSLPTIITLSEDLVTVQEVPFPSVTICPHKKVKQSEYSDKDMQKTIDGIYNGSQPDFINVTNDRRMFEAVCLLNGLMVYGRNTKQQQFIDAKVIEQMIKVSPTLQDVFMSCESYQKRIRCKNLFEPVLTMEGVCFTMNSLAASEILREDRLQTGYRYLNTSVPSVGWSHFGGYSDFNSSTRVYPKSGGGNTYNLPDVNIVLKQYRENESNMYHSDNDGYKVYLHHPADLPQSSAFHYSAPLEQTISLGIKLSVMNTSSSLSSYSLDTRRCYFPKERQLRYFLMYTDSNCRLECLANYTLELCGCVWFHIPHNDTSICRASKIDCLKRAMIKSDKNEGGYSKGGRCRCYPLCLHIQYEADILKTLKFDSSKASRFMNSRNRMNDLSPYIYTRIELFYKAPQFVAMRRSELFGLTDFLASCGGLLGLFLGFSILSLVEILYFLTLRLGCSLRRDKQQANSATAKRRQLS